MNSDTCVRPEESLREVKCEIHGRLARRAHELERLGDEISCLNIGKPGAFGFSTPESMRLAIIENLAAGAGNSTRRESFQRAQARGHTAAGSRAQTRTGRPGCQ